MKIRYAILTYFFLAFSIAKSEFLFQNDFNKLNSDFLTIGFDKVSNIYNFDFEMIKKINTSYGDFAIIQNYRGDAVETANINFRDQEQASILFRTKQYTNFRFLLSNNWIYSADNVNTTDNIFQRANSNFGLEYSFFEKSKISTLAGYEYNQQTGFKSSGFVYAINSQINENFNDIYSIESLINYENVKLADKRNNSDLKLNFTLAGNYSQNNLLNFSFTYSKINKDYISYYSNNNNSIVENRTENNYDALLGMKFDFLQKFKIDSKLSFNNIIINRNFKEKYEPISYSSIKRLNNTLLIDLNFNISYISDRFFSVLTTKFYNRNELYNVEKQFELSETEFETYKKQETSLNNSTYSSSFGNSGFALFFKNDSLFWNSMISIYRYDTPDKVNNDDKDELNQIMMLDYHKKVNHHININILGEIRYKHLVFLKSQRSSQNNKNRIIRFSPTVSVFFPKCTYIGTSEVLANYTIYDYEDIIHSIHSYSFRQISYKDSLEIKLFNQINLLSSNFIRYFANGILLWNEFLEIPQIGNFEYECKLLLNKRLNTFNVAVGLRLYTFSKYDLQNQNTEKLYSHLSIGPQTQIIYSLSKKSIISLSGWYERQFINGKEHYVPNLKLNTRTSL